MAYKRYRLLYGIITIAIIVLGICIKKVPNLIPNFLSDYLGDALWAAMIFFGIGFVFKTMKTKKVALNSIAFCYIIEFSQLYHASWIDNIRNTTLGGLVLGYAFSWTDLISYAIGIVIAVIFEEIIIYKGMIF